MEPTTGGATGDRHLYYRCLTSADTFGAVGLSWDSKWELGGGMARTHVMLDDEV
jgi:hypothetical protein